MRSMSFKVNSDLLRKNRFDAISINCPDYVCMCLETTTTLVLLIWTAGFYHDVIRVSQIILRFTNIPPNVSMTSDVVQIHH